jgi:hypothetical protein
MRFPETQRGWIGSNRFDECGCIPIGTFTDMVLSLGVTQCTFQCRRRRGRRRRGGGCGGGGSVVVTTTLILMTTFGCLSFGTSGTTSVHGGIRHFMYLSRHVIIYVKIYIYIISVVIFL